MFTICTAEEERLRRQEADQERLLRNTEDKQFKPLLQHSWRLIAHTRRIICRERLLRIAETYVEA